MRNVLAGQMGLGAGQVVTYFEASGKLSIAVAVSLLTVESRIALLRAAGAIRM